MTCSSMAMARFGTRASASNSSDGSIPRQERQPEYPVPLIKNDLPTGALDLEIDAKGDIWIALMFQGGVTKFDRKTETFRMYPLPEQFQDDRTQVTMVSPAYSQVDGKVWTKASQRPNPV